MTVASNRALAVVSLSVAFAALALSDNAAAFCRMTTEGGDEYSSDLGAVVCVERGEPFAWHNTCLSYAIDSRGSYWMDYEEVEEAVDLAFQAWQEANCGDGMPNLFFQPLNPSTCRRAEYNCNGNVNTIAFLGSPDEPSEEWKDPCATPQDLPYDPGAFAVTIVWHDTATGEIFDADMMINDRRASRVTAGGPYANCAETGCTGDDADLRSIITHEAGHFIGIGHCNPGNPANPDPNDPCVTATMYKQNDRQSVDKRTLAPDDVEAVCSIYPPGNLDPSTCEASPNGGLQLNCETDASGNPIACSESACAAGGGSGGCSTTSSPADAPWSLLLVALLAITLRRCRPGSSRTPRTRARQ